MFWRVLNLVFNILHQKFKQATGNLATSMHIVPEHSRSTHTQYKTELKSTLMMLECKKWDW